MTNTESPATLARLNTLLERAERVRAKRAKGKHKLYAQAAQEVKCIGKVQDTQAL